MKYMQIDSAIGKTYIFEEDNKFLKITFGGNGDLYWTLNSKNIDNENTFIITKENYNIFRLFEELFNDIKNINIFDEDDIPFYLETAEEKNEYLRKHMEEIAAEKELYRKFNHSNYNELYNDLDRIITWYSDETAHEVSNILKIKKEKDTYELIFFKQPFIKGYDRDFNTPNSIPIRFRNSGSIYDPFNIVFMNMYNKMNEIDDINDTGHQIHIEEYLYNKN